jgi:hypothetical protein
VENSPINPLSQSLPQRTWTLPKRLAFDPLPVAPVRMLLCPGHGRGGSRCRNILVPRHPRAARTLNLEIGSPRAGHPAKINNRNGSRSSLLSPSTADRRVPPLVIVVGRTTADSTAAAAGSRAPLGDPVLLFELFQVLRTVGEILT